MEMTWGNAGVMVAMSERIGKGKGFGDVLAERTQVAREKLDRCLR